MVISTRVELDRPQVCAYFSHKAGVAGAGIHRELALKAGERPELGAGMKVYLRGAIQRSKRVIENDLDTISAKAGFQHRGINSFADGITTYGGIKSYILRTLRKGCRGSNKGTNKYKYFLHINNLQG